MDLWLKEIAPSAELRRWFAHDEARWEQFRLRYWDELRNNSEALDQLKHEMSQGTVTLVYAARDQTHNSALALRQFLEQRG